MRSWKTSLWGILEKRKMNNSTTTKRKQASFHRLKKCRRLVERRQLHSFQYTDAKILTPCTQGCSRTCAALKRSVASRTSSFEMRSLAPCVMWAQSLSGNSYFPCWILSNNWLCTGKYPISWNQNNTHQDQIHSSKCWLENRRDVFSSLLEIPLKWVLSGLLNILYIIMRISSSRLRCCGRNLPS